MKVTYDAKTDILSVKLRPEAKVAQSDEPKSGYILDYDQTGNIIAFEILDASKNVSDTSKVEYEIAT